MLLVEPLAKHAHNALDSTLDYALRDYDDKSSMKIRGQVCNGFRTESSLMYIVKRLGIDGAEARVISLLSASLLSMPLPELFSKLSPIFVLSKVKLVAATSDADSIAAQFSTTELMKTKLHLLAGESILNTDGVNHHHGYDRLAKENITTESTEAVRATEMAMGYVSAARARAAAAAARARVVLARATAALTHLRRP